MADIYQALQKFKSEGKAAMIVTVIDVQGAGPVEIGKKMIVSDKDEQVGTVGGGAIEYEARETCKTLIKERRSSMNKYVLSEGTIIKDAKTLPMICGGVVTLFYEYVGYDHFITIFGGGHIGQALTNVLKTMNLHVTVIDEREDVYQTFKNADEKFHMLFTDYIDQYGIKEDSFVVVCTPSHEHDYNVINKIIELDFHPKYIGMLCSPKKLAEYIKQTKTLFDRDINLKNFYSPIGLDLGGGSPEEIAISIASEILLIAHDRPLQHMRETNGSHHRYWED